MSDRNYMHEFLPNRRGVCKQYLSNGLCHEPEDAIVHKRWEESERIRLQDELAGEQ